MNPKSESASTRRRSRQTTPGPSNAELLEHLNLLGNVLGLILLSLHTQPLPLALVMDIVRKCGIPVVEHEVAPDEAVH